MKDSEGTIQQDSDAGRKASDAAGAATTGAVIGAVAGGGKGAGIGAGIGGVAGIAIAMLSRGSDVRLETGTSIEMEIQREVTVDASRISAETQPGQRRWLNSYFNVNIALTCAVTVTFCGLNSSVGAGVCAVAAIAFIRAIGAMMRTFSNVSIDA